MAKKNFLKYFKYLLFFAIFIGLVILIGILIISFRDDDIICCKLTNYLSEFYYKKVLFPEKRNMMYMGESSEINDIIGGDQPWYYVRGAEEGIKGGTEKKKEGGGVEEIREGRRSQSRTTRLGGSRGDEIIDSRPRETRVTRTLFPRTEHRDFNGEAEVLVQSRRECLKVLKSLLRFTNVTILTELPRNLNNFNLNDYKIIRVPDKIFYIKRDVFYNGDRERVKLLIEKLRDFHNKGDEFSRMEGNIEPRRGRALSFSNAELDRDLRWFLNSLNPYNPRHTLPSIITFYKGHFGSTHSPTPEPFSTKSSTTSFNPIIEKMSIKNIINEGEMQKQKEIQIQGQENVQKKEQEQIQILDNSNFIEQKNVQREEQGQVIDKSNLLEQNKQPDYVQHNKISIGNLIEQEQNNKLRDDSKRISIDSLIEQKKRK
jgi:hypothetical protein